MRPQRAADLSLDLLNFNNVIDFSDLCLDESSTFHAELSDSGSDPVKIAGAVFLDNASLDVTSTRTNSEYGILRVLIQNDKTEKVVGTFKDLPEGAAVVVENTVEQTEEGYYITYKYNAEAGEFDTGNDVALVSSPYAVWAAADEVEYEYVDQVLDATKYTPHEQYQLSPSLWSSHDPAWAGGDPEFAYSIAEEDSSIASVSTTGLVTFLESGTCTIYVVATETGKPDQTFELRLTGAVGAYDYYVPDAITSENVGDYVLVLYNADSTDSTDLAEYYQENRPGMENANYLGITGVDDATYASVAECESIVSQVRTWLDANPSKPIRYIVGLCGLPSREAQWWQDGCWAGTSVSYLLYEDALSVSSGPGYKGGEHRFSLAEYGAPLVAWLDCGSYAATYAFIDKEIAAANASGLQADGVTISGNAAGVGGNTWVLDDTCHGSNYTEFGTFAGDGAATTFFDSYLTRIAPNLPQDSIVQHNTDPYGPIISSAENPTAYASWGVHSGELYFGDANAWPVCGQVTFSGNAGWWIGMSMESDNGIYGCDMADPVECFAATAFGGGSNGVPQYANTPICWTGATYEPYLGGAEGVDYLDRWARGWSTLEAAWAGRNTEYFLAVTDIGLEAYALSIMWLGRQHISRWLRLAAAVQPPSQQPPSSHD